MSNQTTVISARELALSTACSVVLGIMMGWAINELQHRAEIDQLAAYRQAHDQAMRNELAELPWQRGDWVCEPLPALSRPGGLGGSSCVRLRLDDDRDDRPLFQRRETTDGDMRSRSF